MIKKPKKECQVCGHNNPVAVKECKLCQAPFPKKKNSKNKKGIKTCTCGEEMGARKRQCPNCFRVFEQKIPNNLVNWKELESGQDIKIVPGTGPYTLSRQEDYTEEKISMGYSGKHKVIRLGSVGVHTWQNGHCYVYCGPSFYDEKIGLYKEEHKMVLLDARGREVKAKKEDGKSGKLSKENVKKLNQILKETQE